MKGDELEGEGSLSPEDNLELRSSGSQEGETGNDRTQPAQSQESSHEDSQLSSSPDQTEQTARPRFSEKKLSQEDSDVEEFDDDSTESFTHEGGGIEFEHDDPLAPAYDIEKGTPLSHHRGIEQEMRSNVKSAKEFFLTEILYRFDILEDEERDHLKGKYRIELKGYQGGIWTIDVGEQLEVVNRRDDAEIVFTMQQRDFLQLVNGQLNPQLAIFAQKMRVSGDVKKAVMFQAILAPNSD